MVQHQRTQAPFSAAFQKSDRMHCAGEVGNVWSFNFFFYNRKQKRILYFACRGKTHAAASSSGEESSECAYNSDAEVLNQLSFSIHKFRASRDQEKQPGRTCRR